MGRPAAFAVALGLPGSLSSTKRFMSSVRAAIVRRENDCAFRAVRNLVKATSSCEHAAESVSRREAAGPAMGGAGSVRELDSCAVARLVAARPTSGKRGRRRARSDFHFNVKMFGRFGKLHLKKEIIHISNNARHAIRLLDFLITSMPKKLRCKKVGASQPPATQSRLLDQKE